jgi:hypothetical protein
VYPERFGAISCWQKRYKYLNSSVKVDGKSESTSVGGVGSRGKIEPKRTDYSSSK